MITPLTVTDGSRAKEGSCVLADFTGWLERYGETSWDHQSFFAGSLGRRAKAIYYRNRYLGTAAVAPMIFVEAFLPSARRFFHHPERFPIADAHYAMGFAFLYELTADLRHLQRATHFLDELVASRCSGFGEYCWGYPSDWVTRNGVVKAQTPLITSTPYCYEAFLQVAEILGQRSEIRDQRSEVSDRRPPTAVLRPLSSAVCPPAPDLRSLTSDLGSPTSDPCHPSSALCPPDLPDEYRQITASIARHAANDIKDFPTSSTASSCSYTPFGEGGVINAAAYRAFLLTSASQVFENPDYWKVAERNLELCPRKSKY